MMLGQKVILASDFAQLFHLRKVLFDVSSSSPSQVAELCEENLLKHNFCKIFNRSFELPGPKHWEFRNGKSRLVDDPWLLNPEVVDSCLSALNLSTAGCLSGFAEPAILEHYRTNSSFGPETSEKSLVSAFRKILFDPDIVPFLPGGIELINSVTFDSSPEPEVSCGFSIKIPFLIIPCLDNLDNNGRYIFMEFARDICSEINALIGDASRMLRNKTYNEQIIDVVEDLLNEIYTAGQVPTRIMFNEFNSCNSSGKDTKDYYACSLRVSTAEKLIEEYILLGMLNPAVQDSIFELFVDIDPDTCFLSVTVDHLTVDVDANVVLKK